MGHMPHKGPHVVCTRKLIWENECGVVIENGLEPDGVLSLRPLRISYCFFG